MLHKFGCVDEVSGIVLDLVHTPAKQARVVGEDQPNSMDTLGSKAESKDSRD